jgi:hypothetical protein
MAEKPKESSAVVKDFGGRKGLILPPFALKKNKKGFLKNFSFLLIICITCKTQ